MKRFVAEMSAAWARYVDLAAVSPAVARKIAEEVRAPWTRGGPQMAKTLELELPVRVRFYDPGLNAPKPALIYLHGGGWTIFSLDTHDRLMREYAARAHTVVIGVDYALAPEAKYPVALNQVVAVGEHVAANAAKLGIDPQRIAIGGDSAGANLALAAALRLKSRRILHALVLNYGVFARHSSQAAIEQFGGEGNMLTASEMEAFWQNYLGGQHDSKDPFVTPIHADLRGLPPALLVVPECDLLAEQSIELEKRMRAAGVAVKLAMYHGAVHSFLEAVSIAPLADWALTDTAAWLRSTDPQK